jgi:hypothetical protein
VADDCGFHPLSLEPELLRVCVMRIFQREKKACQAGIAFPATVPLSGFPVPFARLQLHRCEAAENIPICVPYDSESVRAAVAAAVEFGRAKAVTAATPEKVKMFFAELIKH